MNGILSGQSSLIHHTISEERQQFLPLSFSLKHKQAEQGGSTIAHGTAKQQ
jgi:hypothetical protein